MVLRQFRSRARLGQREMASLDPERPSSGILAVSWRKMPWEKIEHNLEAGIERHPTVVPIPLAIVIRDKSSRVSLGSVSAEELRKTLAEWDRMTAAYEA